MAEVDRGRQQQIKVGHETNAMHTPPPKAGAAAKLYVTSFIIFKRMLGANTPVLTILTVVPSEQISERPVRSGG